MTAKNVSAELRKLAFAAGVALGLSVAAASVLVAAPAASASTRFVDHGGRVLSAARVYPIYWGRYWAPDRVASPTPDQITHALRTVLTGSYLSGLTQYRHIGPAVLHGSRVITTTDPGSRFTDRDIEAFLDALFDAEVLPAAGDQAIYVVTIPPGIYASGDDIVGEHNYYQRAGHKVHYAWITDSVALEGATQTTTHEIVETVTDPEGTAILGTPGTCDGEKWCEIADICSDPAKLHGVMVAPYWSNIAGHCVIPAPPSLASSDGYQPKVAASDTYSHQRAWLAHGIDGSGVLRRSRVSRRFRRAATRDPEASLAGNDHEDRTRASAVSDAADAEFAAFVAAQSTPLYRVAYLMTGDRHRAEDAVQTALMRIYRAWSRRASWESPEAYAHQVVTRIVISSSQRRWWGERPTDDLIDRPAPDSGAVTEAIDQRDALRRALAALPSKQRSAVVLRYYLDMSEADVASAMQCPVGSVKSLTSRGLQSLRSRLAELP